MLKRGQVEHVLTRSVWNGNLPYSSPILLCMYTGLYVAWASFHFKFCGKDSLWARCSQGSRGLAPWRGPEGGSTPLPKKILYLVSTRYAISFSSKLLKVGVNHGIFHIYHFWNFLIFKCTWVYSSSSSKNKHIFLNLSINSINSKMSIYLSISKMCSSLFSRGNQTFARIANAKRTTQSRDATLSAITDIDYQSPLCTMCTCIRVSLFGKHWSKTGPKSDFIR